MLSPLTLLRVAILALPVIATPTHVKRSRHTKLSKRVDCAARLPSSSAVSSTVISPTLTTPTSLDSGDIVAMVSAEQGMDYNGDNTPLGAFSRSMEKDADLLFLQVW